MKGEIKMKIEVKLKILSSDAKNNLTQAFFLSEEYNSKNNFEIYHDKEENMDIAKLEIFSDKPLPAKLVEAITTDVEILNLKHGFDKSEIEEEIPEQLDASVVEKISKRIEKPESKEKTCNNGEEKSERNAKNNQYEIPEIAKIAENSTSFDDFVSNVADYIDMGVNSGKNYGEGLKTQRGLTEEEESGVNSVITDVEKMVEQTKKMQKNEIRENAELIIKEIYKIVNYPLTIEQLEKLYFLMASNTLQQLRRFRKDTIDLVIVKTRKMIIQKMAEAIDIAQSQTDEVEELKRLKRKITTEMTKMEPIIVGGVKRKIEGKIARLHQHEVLDKIKNDIPANIETIIRSLANGTLDIQEANRIINEEAKRRVDSKPKTKFSLNEEQERKQVLIQINTVLMEKAKKYQIVNPEASIKQAQELFGDGIEQTIRMVVMNLVGREKFEIAKEICNKYSEEEEYFNGPMAMLRREVKNAEIGNMVLRGINMHGTEKEENEYFEMLEKGLKSGNVRLGSVSLEKSKDGLRNITLADIWVDENQRGK